MKNDQPKISIIIPCYNQGKYLDECIQSVINQKFKNWECIIVDDGSADETSSKISQWKNRDKRIKGIIQSNLGLSAARNRGIEKAQGIYLLPLDADDRISQDYVEKALQEFEKDPSLKLVYCNAEKFENETGNWKLPDFSLYNLAIENMIFCSAVYKKTDWVKIGGYDEKMKNGWEDWEFWIALLKGGGKVKKLEINGFFYRVKKDSMTRKIKPVNFEELFKYLNIKHPDFFVQQHGSFHSLNSRIIYLERENLNLKQNQENILSNKYYRLYKWFSKYFL